MPSIPNPLNHFALPNCPHAYDYCVKSPVS
jgi:hypothetical protein